MKEKEKKGLSKRFWIITLLICLIVIIFFVVGVVISVNRKPDVVNKTENGGSVRLNYTSNSNSFIVEDLNPLSDEEGIKINDPAKIYDFSVTTSLKKSKNITYELSIKKIKDKTNVDDKDIRIYLEKEDSGSYNSVMDISNYSPLKKSSNVGTKDGMVLYKQTVSKNSTDNYRLRVWLSDKSTLTSAKYAVEVNIKAIAK